MSTKYIDFVLFLQSPDKRLKRPHNLCNRPRFPQVTPAARKTWEEGKVFHSSRIGIAAQGMN
jgi:hypothetical protein